MKLRSSSDRHTFQKQTYLNKKLEQGKTPNNDKNVKAMLDYYENISLSALEREQDPEWQKNNLEYDLRVSEKIADKCKDTLYAQHLYAALCDNEFIKNDVWPILKDERWRCSWRAAGGIVANIVQTGDYIDWYCTGMMHGNEIYTQEEIDMMTEDQRQKYKEIQAYVPEGTVTDEIAKDLLELGWIIAGQSK